MDESPEELRVKAMQALRAGNPTEYVSQCDDSVTFSVDIVIAKL